MEIQRALQQTRVKLQEAAGRVAERTKRVRTLETGLALACLFSPALMILLDSENGIRPAISAYWNMPAPVVFYVPLTMAAMLFVFNGVSKKENEYNWILGAALMMLVIFNQDEFNLLHRAGVYIFFAGNVVVVGSAIAKKGLKAGVLAGAALFFVAGNFVDGGWSTNWLLWLEWASLVVIATHFILVVWTAGETYQAPLSPKKRAPAG